MNFNDDIITLIVETVNKEGIVTRNECSSLDSRPFGSNLVEELHYKGYLNIQYVEENINNYSDYTGAVFDINKYDENTAREYLRKKVLNYF